MQMSFSLFERHASKRINFLSRETMRAAFSFILLTRGGKHQVKYRSYFVSIVFTQKLGHHQLWGEQDNSRQREESVWRANCLDFSPNKSATDVTTARIRMSLECVWVKTRYANKKEKKKKHRVEWSRDIASEARFWHETRLKRCLIINFRSYHTWSLLRNVQCIMICNMTRALHDVITCGPSYFSEETETTDNPSKKQT